MAMARVIPISNAFPCSLNPTVRYRNRHCHVAPLPAATDDGGDTTDKSDETSSSSTDPDFDRRLSELSSRYTRKGTKDASRRLQKLGIPREIASAYLKDAKSVMLPPVPLKEAKSASGVPVKIGFSAYSERINGYLASLGLVALLLVELGSGQSVIKYHSPGIVFLQVYTATGLAAVFIKYEKEKISVWPKSRDVSSATATVPEK